MNYFIVLLLVSVFSVNASYAFNEIEYKKAEALEWYAYNITGDKYSARNELAVLKNKALNWYENYVSLGTPYAKHAQEEVNFKKQKALKWYANHK